MPGCLPHDDQHRVMPEVERVSWKRANGTLWETSHTTAWQKRVNLGSGPLGSGPPAVGPVVVVVDVGGDHLPGLVEGLELVAPDAAFLEVAEPGFDERLALGVAVAAAAMRDAEPGDHEPGRAGGERGAVVGAERQRAREDALLGDRPSRSPRSPRTARQRRLSCQPTISRVQQSMIAFR